MKQADKFKRALQLMYENGEFDKIIKHKDYTRAERNNAEHDKKLIAGIMEHFCSDINKISYIPVLHDLRSVNVLKDAITIMIGLPDEESEG